MAGLGLILIVIVWTVLSVGFSLALARLGNTALAKSVIFVTAAPAIFFLPVVDEFLGSQEIDRLCGNSDTLRIHGSIPVGTDFYTPTGEWRLAKVNWSDHAAFLKLVKQADALVRWDSGGTTSMSGLVPIGERQTRIYNRATDALMAEWTDYHFAGGFLRRNVWPAGQACRPPLLRKAGYALYEKLFRFQP